ncbi:uncharacterized protein TRIREDRAFT_107674 [Trichoderma reesei QM6a]|jgi:hypothetical protein|uniref:Predicted protein n=2 Tax=Hypocrea jecorina TaxID=51453 RepID=G0RKR3_HYPJQ|nr:uncharacterized protein TRIREDRAFT_107674 [Trichoderma reesei QM6a]EGR48364.1 predicted protein [Trichoderma reesei QM6a]ETS06928.1 hypothetical protein M419DRAFT_32194 [Trichoderma reesei RUT C-30]
MSQSPITSQQQIQSDKLCYPPCIYITPEEKKLYKKLKDVYLDNYTTWDAESREAWPYIVEHASLPKSTVGKMTNHSITRNMMCTKVTWAHVVALRIIYKAQIFKSKKIMKLIRDKYPRGNFNTYAFHEHYRTHVKVDENVKAEKAAQKSPAVALNAREPRDCVERPVGEASQPAARRLNESSNGFLSDEEDARQSTWIVAAPSSTRREPTSAAENRGKEGHMAMSQQDKDGANHRQHVAYPSNRRKRALPEDIEGESEISHSAARDLKQRKGKPSTAANDDRTHATSSGKGRHREREGRGCSHREKEDRDDELDRFIQALTGFGKSLSEHSKAVHRNSELLERLTEQIRKRGSRRA